MCGCSETSLAILGDPLTDCLCLLMNTFPCIKLCAHSPKLSTNSLSSVCEASVFNVLNLFNVAVKDASFTSVQLASEKGAIWLTVQDCSSLASFCILLSCSNAAETTARTSASATPKLVGAPAHMLSTRSRSSGRVVSSIDAIKNPFQLPSIGLGINMAESEVFGLSMTYPKHLSGEVNGKPGGSMLTKRAAHKSRCLSMTEIGTTKFRPGWMHSVLNNHSSICRRYCTAEAVARSTPSRFRLTNANKFHCQSMKLPALRNQTENITRVARPE